MVLNITSQDRPQKCRFFDLNISDMFYLPGNPSIQILVKIAGSDHTENALCLKSRQLWNLRDDQEVFPYSVVDIKVYM